MKGIILSGTALLSAFSIAKAQVAIHVEKSATITFTSENNRAYKLLAAEDPTATWRVLKDGIAGTGGEVTIFYKSESDQKLFFKIEVSDGPPGQRSLLSLARLDVSERDLTGYDLEGADLRQYKFYNSILDKADLAGADLRGTGFQNASMKSADLRNVVLGNTSFYGVNFAEANLSGMVFDLPDVFFSAADFRGAKLDGTRFLGSPLSGAIFAGDNLANCSFRGSRMDQVNLSGCNLTGADLRGTILNGANLSGAIVAGTTLEGAGLNGASLAGIDPRGINLRGVNIGAAALSGLNLSGSDLSLIHIIGSLPPTATTLTGANLSGCNLTGLTVDSINLPGGIALISQVNFRDANLTGASFHNCNIYNCDFTGANLSFADFTGASLAGSTGFNADQPGMQFGPRGGFPPGPGLPPDPLQQGTVLPDGTTRSGANPGTPLAPAAAPERLLLNIDDGGVKSTVDLPTQGQFTYSPRAVTATVSISSNGPSKSYTLFFTSTTGDRLFQNINGTGETGVWLIGTFQIP